MMGLKKKIMMGLVLVGLVLIRFIYLTFDIQKKILQGT